MIKKKTISEWYGKGVVSGRDNVPLPHKAGAVGVGVEGPKRKTPLKKKPVKSTKIPMPKKPLTDKYGRVISRKESNKREGYRKTVRSGATADAQERTVNSSATSVKAKTESKRRTKYRKDAPNDTYRTKTQNLTMPKGLSSRTVNSLAKRVAKKTVGTADRKQQAVNTVRNQVSVNYNTRKAYDAAKKTKGTADSKQRAALARRKKG